MREEDRRLAVAFIVAAALSVAYGSVLGLIWMLALFADAPTVTLTVSHPYVMVFGALTFFVFGVGILLIPRFRNVDFGIAPLGYTSLSLISLGTALWALEPASPSELSLYATTSVFIGVMLYSQRLLTILLRPQGNLAVGEAFIFLSLFSLLLSLLGELLDRLGTLNAWAGMASLELTLLTLMGFVGSMIFGISIKTIHFRIARLNKLTATLSFVFHTLGVIYLLFSLFTGRGNVLFPLLLFLVSSALLIVSIGGLIVDTSSAQFRRMNERDRTRYLYFAKATRVAFIWLFASLLFGLLSQSPRLPFLSLRDATIHALSIGFIGHTIMAYAPILLPGLISRQMPYIGLSLAPLYLLSVANAWRIAGFILRDLSGRDPLFTWSSGFFVALSMVWFVLMVHRLR